MPSSMSSRLAKPSSYIRMAAMMYPVSRKLTMKPDRSLVRMGCLPSFWANANAVCAVSGSVSSATTISTSFITGTGEKKWTPTTRPGCCTLPASSAIGMDEVFVAITLPGLTSSSSSLISDTLQIEDLRDRLDHDVRARDVFQIRGEGDPGQHLVALGLVHLAVFDRAGQRLLHPRPGGIEELRQVTDDNGHARDRGHLGDARSHEPATYDADRVDLSRHGCTPPPDRPDLLCIKSTPNVPLSAW